MKCENKRLGDTKMSRKVGQVTLYNYNYGSALQCFATQRVVEQAGYSCVLFRESEKNGVWRKMFYLIKALAKAAVHPTHARGFLCMMQSKRKTALTALRESDFKGLQQFVEEDIFSVKLTYTEMKRVARSDEFAAFISGSDQIWKPSVVDDIYMLNFTGEEKVRKFSYAASLSVDSLQEGDKERYSNWLSKLNGISVREKKAVELLQPLTEKEVIQVCDPVFLIDKQEWLALSGSNRKIEENYLFCYFLGDDKNYRLYAKQFAESRGYKIVTFPNLLQVPRKVDSSFGDYKIYDASPLDFVNIIAKASFVITDSFHATTFSIINNTPFAVFERNAVLSMNSRISGLLEPLCLEERFVSNYKQLAGLSDTFKWDFVNTKIKGEQQRALCYLHEQLI